MRLTHRHLHLLEKVQVQLAAVAAVALVYFALWPVLRPSDPCDPLVLVAGGTLRSTAVFAGVLWFLAAACAVVTVSARPEGALMAGVLGAGGASLRSAQMRGLLWTWDGPLAGVFPWLIAELALLAALLLVAAGIVDVVRRLIAIVRPGWVRRTAPVLSGRGGDDRPAPATLLGLFGPRGDGGDAARTRTARATAARSLAAAGAALAVGVVLVLLLLRSPDRGQILFALVAAFLLAALAAHQAFPTVRSVVILCVPIVAGAGFYLLSGVQSPDQPEAWKLLPHYARILPADWLTGGCGGALIGYWMSERINEMRHLEQRREGSAAA
ncbi:MAG: hypothetical protein ACOC8F_04760 [Planctomycetota bacterium]